MTIELEYCPYKYKPQKATKDRTMTVLVPRDKIWIDAVGYRMLYRQTDRYESWFPNNQEYVDWVLTTLLNYQKRSIRSFEVLSLADWHNSKEQHFYWAIITPIFNDKCPSYEHMNICPVFDGDKPALLQKLKASPDRGGSQYYKDWLKRKGNELKQALPDQQHSLIDECLEF